MSAKKNKNQNMVKKFKISLIYRCGHDTCIWHYKIWNLDKEQSKSNASKYFL